MLVPNRTDIQ
jgi:hypothetical protein